MKNLPSIKRVVLLGLLGCSLMLPLQVQSGGMHVSNKITASVKKTSIGRIIQSERISYLLQRRLKTSFQRARQAQQELLPQTAGILGEPVRRVRRAKDMPQVRVYEDKPFLTTRQQTANYMAAQSNRLFVQQSEYMRAWTQQVQEHLPQLQEAARNTPQPEYPIPWLTQHIPTKTTTLFVGEVHDFPEIRANVQMLLIFLRQQNPEREIFLFTEFLPENFRWSKEIDPASLDYPEYTPVWEQAAQEHIETIGLEPAVAMDDFCDVEVIAHNGSKRLTSQWAHLEGMRLRNEAWVRTLETYRKEHPNALFVVYTGAFHSAYYFPFSLPTTLSKERPFVVSLYPDKDLVISGKWIGTQQIVRREGSLEAITKHIVFRQRVLQFKNPTLSKLAGFDVGIRITVDPQFKDLF